MAPLVLAGCGFFGQGDQARLPGERISVMLFDRALEPDPRIADLAVILPPPEPLTNWPQPGGLPSHALHHLPLPAMPQVAWTANIGSASTSTRRILASPIVADGTVYTMDTESRISAFDAATGQARWYFDPKVPDDDDAAFGGGLAFAEGRLIMSTGFAQLIAVDAATGTEIWRKQLSAPMRAAPTIAQGRAFVVTIDNQLFALDAATGDRLWTHAGFSEVAGLLGGASPAVDGDTVVVPYSSGEVFALRVENGRVLWSDNLSSSRRLDALSGLADIRGMPVIDRGLVYAVSHSGRMAAVDLRSGGRAWEQNVGGTEMPWVAGDFLFLVTNDAEIICLTRRDGRIRWVRPLPLYVDAKDREGRIKWSGPVLGGDRLIVAGSHGEALSVSPYTGAILGRFKLPDRTYLAPVLADGTLYFLTEDADLIAMR